MEQAKRKMTVLKSALVLTLLTSGFAFCDSMEVLDVVMTVQNVSIYSVSTGPYVVVSTLTSSKIVGPMIYRNDGNGPETFSIKIASNSGSWAPITTAYSTPNSMPGANQFRLGAIFHNSAFLPTISEFNDNDIVTSNLLDSSETIFFNDNDPLAHLQDTSTPPNNIKDQYLKGNNIPGLDPNNIFQSQRNLYIRYDAPSSGSGSVRATLNVVAKPAS